MDNWQELENYLQQSQASKNLIDLILDQLWYFYNGAIERGFNEERAFTMTLNFFLNAYLGQKKQ